MQFIVTNTFMPANLVKPAKIWINGFGRKVLIPFGILMAFLLSGAAAIAQCPGSVNGNVLSVSNPTVCSGQNSSINISVTPASGGTYSGGFSNGRSFMNQVPNSGFINPSFTFINNGTTSVTETFTLTSLVFTPTMGSPCNVTPTITNNNPTVTVQPVPVISAMLTTPVNTCSGNTVSISLTNPTGVSATYDLSINYNGATGTKTNATGQAYPSTFTDVLTTNSATGVTVTYTFTPRGTGSLNCTGSPVNISVTVYNNGGIYVNDGSTTGDTYTFAAGNDATGNGTRCAPYATIQKAINVAISGNTIYVDAGTYAEYVNVDKALTFIGTKTGIDPRPTGTVARPGASGESIVVPSSVDTTNAGGTLFTLSANNISFDGFTFNGNNTALAGGQPVNGVNIQASRAFVNLQSPLTAITNLTVRNNIIINMYRTGVYLFGPGPSAPQQNNIVDKNVFDNIHRLSGTSTAVYVEQESTTDVTNNLMTRVGRGAFTATLSGNLTTPVSLSNNNITSYFTGIWVNNHYGATPVYTIANNTLATQSGATGNDGIRITSIQTSSQVNVSNNIISPSRYGYYLWNCPTTSTITLNGGSVTGGTRGVNASNYYPGFGDAAVSTYIVSNVNIQNSSAAGIYVDDNNLNTNNASVAVTVQGGTLINNAATGLLIAGANASATFGTGTPPAAFTGQAKYISYQSNGTDVPSANITATAVTFDGNTGATATLAQNYTIEDKIDHKIDSAVLGFVLVKAGNDFVTPASFIAPSTMAKVQRGVDASSSGFIVNVKEGTYNDNLVINKNLTFQGAQTGVAGTASRPVESLLLAPTTGSDQLFSLSGTGTTVTFDGFKFDGKNIGAVNDGTQKLYIRNTIAELDFSPASNNLYSIGDSLVLTNNLFKAEVGTNDGSASHIFSGSKLVARGNTFTSADAVGQLNGGATSSLPVWLNITTGTQYAAVDSNLFTTIDIGVLLADNASGVTISNNDFTDAKRSARPNNSNTGFGAGIALFQTLTGSGNSINNNNFTNSETGVRSSAAGAGPFALPAGLVVNLNSFTNISDTSIRLSSAFTGTLNAECNWFGTVGAGAIDATTSNQVDFTPYLLDGTDNSPARGFQTTATCGVVNQLYVNDNSLTGDKNGGAVGNDNNPGTAALPYRTIQKAINSAVDGNTIFVDAGSYAEYVLVNKQLTFSGSQAGVDPRPTGTGTRPTFGEAIVTPPSVDNTNETGTLFTIAANNITVDGFTFNGNNPALSGGDNFTGTNIQTSRAFINQGAGFNPTPPTLFQVNNLTVQNNILRNFTRTGLYLYGGNSATPPLAAQQNNLVDKNVFDNIHRSGATATAVYLEQEATATTTNNNMTRVGRGIFTATLGTKVNVPFSFSNNNISSYFTGIWVNNHYGPAPVCTISNNTLTTEPMAASNDGIRVTSMQTDVQVLVSNNTIAASRNGYVLWNNPTTNTITINGGSVTGGNRGIFATNFFAPFGNASSSLYNINNVSIQNSTVAGINVDDTSANTNGATLAVAISGGTQINNASTGLLIEGSGANASFTGATPAAFTGQAKYIDLTLNSSTPGSTTDAPTANIDATAVSFGGLTGANSTLAQNFDIEDKIDHKIDSAQLGFVLVNANNTYVTPASFIPPGTTAALVQRAADAASAGFTVNVKGGTYNGLINVTKNLNFEGAALGIAGTGARPATESLLIAPATGTSLITLSNASTTASFNGFKFDGTNLAAVLDNTQNLTLTNSIAELDFVPASNNLYSIGNSLTLTNNLFKAIDGTNDGSSSHIFSSAKTLTATGNSFTSTDAINDLNVNGTTSLPVWLNVTTGTTSATIDNNEFNKIDIGVLLADNASNVNITNNDFIEAKRKAYVGPNNGLGAGIALFGDLTGTNLNILNNNFTNSETGIRTSTGSPSNTLPAYGVLKVNRNSFTIITDTSIRIGTGYTGILNAECNWFGTTSANAIDATTSNQVDYTPYLLDGTDANPTARGFQTTASCNGTPVVIASAVPSPQTCSGNGSITVTFSGGTPNYTVSYTDGGVNFGSQGGITASPYTITGLTAGTYTITVTDANGSFATAMATVTNNPVTNVTQNMTYTTIQAAVTAANANDSITVCSGTYNEQVVINKPLKLQGLGPVKPIINYTGTPAVAARATLFDVTAPSVTIRDFDFRVNVTNIGSAILASAANISNLVIDSNEIKPYRSGGLLSFGLRNAVSINYGDGGLRINGANPVNISGTRNVIAYFDNGTPGTADDASFRSGFAMDEATGTFNGNTIQSVSQDIQARFAGAGSLVISNNNINGGGVEIAEQNPGAGTFTVSSNTFNGTFGSTFTSALRLKNNYNAKTTTVSNNTFTGHNQGISLENYQAITVNNNVFTPALNSTTYRHITVDTKEFSSSSGFFAPVINGTFTNNTFNGSGAAGGLGLAFYNEDNDSPVIGPFTIGTAGNENNFNAGVGTFIYLDNTTGTTAPNATPTAPFPTNLDATNNKFDVGSGLQLPSAMSLANLFLLEDKVQHKIDATTLGFVLVKANNTYVTPNSFVAPNTTPKIQRGVDAAGLTGFTENVQNGTYNDNVLVNKGITITGQSQSLVIVRPAFSAPNPVGGGSLPAGASNVFLVDSTNVTIQNLTVDGNNPALTGITVNGSDVDARNGIITNSNHMPFISFNGLNVNNVIVQNVFYRGIYSSTDNTFNFTNNTVTNVAGDPASVAMLNFGGSGFFTNNTVTTSSDGIASNNSTGTTYSGNTVTNSGQGIHTDNPGAGGGTADNIINNTVTNGPTGSLGIFVYQPYIAPTIQANTITNVETGLANFAQVNAVTPIFTQNTVDGQNKPNSTGVYQSTDNFLGTGGTNVSGVYTNNFIRNNDSAFVVEYQSGKTNNITANNNSITGNGRGVLLTGAGMLGTKNFTCNWWGSNNPAAVAAAVGPQATMVTYIPYLSDGTDAQPGTAGFQPMTACSACSTITATVTPTNNLCNGGSDGKVTVTNVMGGVGPYTFTLSGTGSNNTGNSNGMYTGLPAGTYTVTVFGANGCSTQQTPVTVGQPTGTAPDANLFIAAASSYFFPSPMTENTYVYQIFESGGNPINGATLRINKQNGYTYSFNMTATSTMVNNMTYPVDNTRWTADDSDPNNYSIRLNMGNQINCQSVINLEVKLTRNTSNKSNFSVTSLIFQVPGETNFSTNTTTYQAVGN